jgi:hypothetical protein
MNCFSLAEGAKQFEIACEFDDLPTGLGLEWKYQVLTGAQA